MSWWFHFWVLCDMFLKLSLTLISYILVKKSTKQDKYIQKYFKIN